MSISSNVLSERLQLANLARGKARIALKTAISGDNLGNKVPGRLKWCNWKCSRTTKNISEICDTCWKNREQLRKDRTNARPTN